MQGRSFAETRNPLPKLWIWKQPTFLVAIMNKTHFLNSDFRQNPFPIFRGIIASIFNSSGGEDQGML